MKNKTIKIMKKGMKKFGYLAMAFLVVGLASCSKDGDTGPAGAVGPAGAAGQQGIPGVDGEAQGIPGPAGADGTNGTDGADGADGATGTANVIYSPRITIKKNDWNVTQGGKFQTAQIDVPELTQDIFEKGVVLVYDYSAADGGVYSPLPSFRSVDYTFSIRVNKIAFIILDPTIPYIAASDKELRYVLIPGMVSTSGKTSPQQAIYNELQAAGVDINNFAQVAAYYNIQ
jgi:hypothetical protein